MALLICKPIEPFCELNDLLVVKNYYWLNYIRNLGIFPNSINVFAGTMTPTSTTSTTTPHYNLRNLRKTNYFLSLAYILKKSIVFYDSDY